MARNHRGAVHLADKFASFADHWAPRRIANVNDYTIKIVKLKGQFVWHRHLDTDELFLVHRGCMTVRYRDRDVVLRANDVHVVPRGVEHLTLADEECEALVIEPACTVNTGDTDGEMTAEQEPFI
ncbi:MAG: cupin domain-containing protein [Proteobacteria bacterium]|nr:cupin domain-containing protein [Pseudomonadota bacterium]